MPRPSCRPQFFPPPTTTMNAAREPQRLRRLRTQSRRRRSRHFSDLRTLWSSRRSARRRRRGDTQGVVARGGILAEESVDRSPRHLRTLLGAISRCRSIEVAPLPSSRPLDAAAIAVTIGLCLSWGFNNVAIKLAIHDIPPLIQSSARSLIAAFLVGIWTQ